MVLSGCVHGRLGSLLLVAFILLSAPTLARAQVDTESNLGEVDQVEGSSSAKAKHHFGRELPVEGVVETEHEIVIRGETVPYVAQAGTQPVWAEDGHPIASLFYTYYRRSDVDDADTRPLLISFNGGPGSASVWMHLAYTGPRILRIDDEGFPYSTVWGQGQPAFDS